MLPAVEANKYLIRKKAPLQRHRDSNSVRPRASELGLSLELEHVRAVPLGRLLENRPGHLSSTASKNGKQGIAQLR